MGKEPTYITAYNLQGYMSVRDDLLEEIKTRLRVLGEMPISRVRFGDK